ncbi:MAG: amidohydrolase family protein, partial [Gemmatimonadetes bacterium]|nr:amidohydrolase family protein [Gemmatimonadota bacterium]
MRRGGGRAARLMTSKVCNSCARARWVWVAAAITVGAALAVAGCADDAAGPATPADLVLRGGTVATVDADNTMAEAVAITDGWIVAVGSDEEVAAFIGAETEVIELDGRFAAPGFIEGHGHYMSLGNSKTILDLNDAANWDEIVQMVAGAVAEAEPGEWIRGRGWHQEKWDRPPDPVVEGNPTHATLTGVSPDNPVLLGHASGHAAFANALAMELGGYDRDSEPPPGGELVRDENGELTGLLRETAEGPVSAAFADSQLGRTADEIEAQFRR